MREPRLPLRSRCDLLGCYAASSGSSLPTFLDNLSVPFSGVASGIGITTTCCVTAEKSTLVSITNHCIQSDNKQRKTKNAHQRQQNKIKMISLASFFDPTTGTSGFCPKLSRNGLRVTVDFFFFTLDGGLLARSQYSEGPATGHLDTGFSWFPCVYKQMLRWLPTFQVATTCFSYSPPDLNLLVTNFMFCIHVK